MLISLSWLGKYVQVPDDTKTLVEELTMTGLNVERVLQTGFSDPNVVVGRVLSVADHPNADKLRVCRVDVGDDPVREIVCGAPNVAEDQKVLVALPGARLPDGTRIKAAKIRGVSSQGMICSERELGLGDDAAGIMVLDADLAAGAPIGDVLPPPDEVLEIEVTPNRPDLLCHVGVARELAAIQRSPLVVPSVEVASRGDDGTFEVEIEDAKDCARYVGQLVRGVGVGPSPMWLQAALEGVGQGSVNNIVDIMNYVMLELGQPLHAFDFRRVKDHRIIVRRARERERLLALDGAEHELSPEELVIADPRGPVAIAGVIGGEESAVHADTVDILIESASFEPGVVRRGRKRLSISTDASYRFERGVDRDGCLRAAARAAQLVLELAGGEMGPVVDAYPAPAGPRIITIRRAQTRRILGAELTTAEISDHLAALGFETRERSEDALAIEAPAFRPDVQEEIDLIEEVARIYGYDRIGKGWTFRTTTFAHHPPYEQFTESLCDHLAARGYCEVATSSFTDGREIADFGWPDGDVRRSPMPLRNPLNSNHRYLRTSLLPGILDVIRWNLDRGMRRIRLYETGRVFLAPGGADRLPDERMRLAIAVSYPGAPDFWNHSKTTPDLFDIKQEIEIILRSFNIDLGSEVQYDFDVATGQFRYRLKQGTLIEGGVVSDQVSRRYDFEQPVWYASLDLAGLFQHHTSQPRLKPLVEYPSSKRDLSLIAGPGVGYARIEKSLVKSGGRLLESLQLFDVYRGEKVDGDRTAYGVRLTFRSTERTLTDGEVDEIIDKVLTRLRNELKIELRT
ncbi:MAG: phenylalanine--tRNA ligase subunit beta [Candidatus Krumholzibacteriia bacterium]